MTSNPEPIVSQRPCEVHNLLAYVAGPDAQAQTAYTVELTWFRRLLALGAMLLRLCFVTRAAGRPAEPITSPDGTRLTSHDQRPTISYAVFGKGRLWRQAFTAPGHQGLCPLDAELSVPAHGYSDRWREWAADGATDESSRESQPVLARLLGLSLSLQAIDTAVVEAGGEVTTVYERPPESASPPAAATILVVHADGTGGPMVPPPMQRPAVRLAKGPKRTTKQEAIVTGLDTMSPDQRPPQQVVAALRQDPGRPAPAGRPQPVGTALRATLEGKVAAISGLAQRVAQREGPPLQPHVALTDGAEALPQQVVTHLPA